MVVMVCPLLTGMTDYSYMNGMRMQWYLGCNGRGNGIFWPLFYAEKFNVVLWAGTQTTAIEPPVFWCVRVTYATLCIPCCACSVYKMFGCLRSLWPYGMHVLSDSYPPWTFPPKPCYITCETRT